MLLPAPAHPVPLGPLAVRWLAYDVPEVRAGTRAQALVELANAGSATWRSHGTEGVQLAYHWLDPLGNPILWDGIRSPFLRPVAPDEEIAVQVELLAPTPPGGYLLAFDLVHEHRFWFAEVGNAPLELPVTVQPRTASRALGVHIGEGPAELVAATRTALAAQEEAVADEGEATAHLAAGCRPDPDWSRRILDAHAEGYAAVGGSIALDGGFLERRRLRELGPWAPGFGRAPEWPRPLLCPSLLVVAPVEDVLGLPAVDPAAVDGLTLCDGRIRVVVPATALRPTRRPAS